MIETTEAHDIRPLTADETLVVSGGQAVNPGNLVAQGEAALALIEGVVNVFKWLLPR
jgi:hypothetical protein